MADIASPPTLFRKRTNKANFRKRPAAPSPPASDDSEYSSAEDESGREIKRQKKGGVSVGNSTVSQKQNGVDLKATEFAADKTSTITDTNDATKHSNWYEDNQNQKDDLSAKNLLGTSKGKSKQQSIAQKNSDATTQKHSDAPDRKVGPVKAPSNVRTVTTIDFAPNVCKDYKQTGWCGFGDSCIYLHVREDYKQGWELDKEWEVGTKGKKISGQTVSSANRSKTGAADVGEDADNELLENIPFACIICQESYKRPIVTRCGHYFCEKCALDRYKKNPNCAACGEGTAGVFNGAKQLKRLLERKNERAKKRKEAAREAGEDVSSDDENE